MLSRNDGGLLKKHIDRVVLVQALVGNGQDVTDNRKLPPRCGLELD